MELRAPAKINLTLEVLGRRHDGYHQMATVLQTIDLWDTLAVEYSSDLELVCSATEIQGPQNLVWQAASRLREATGCQEGASIRLEKGIPQAMGLGGGSSDAAAALLALDRLWGLGMGQDGLLPIAESLGTDVPFFLQGGTALAEGRGEEITPLPSLPRWWILLLCPPWSISAKTERLYAMLCEENYSQGDATRHLVSALKAGCFSPDLVYNTFEEVAPRAFDGLYEGREAMLNSGAGEVHLCGSGPGLLSFVRSRDDGERIARLLKDTGWKSYLVRTS